MSWTTGVSTPVQKRDKQIRDLKAQIASLKWARQDDEESFQEECRGLEAEISRRADVERMLQREIAKGDAEREALRNLLHVRDAEIAKLKDQIGVYEARLNKDSSNSDKPQSTNIYRKPTPVSTRKRSERKSGGQPGHKGCTMRPDIGNARIIERREGTCSCGGEVVFGNRYGARRIVDIQVNLQTVEERAYNGACLCCGKRFTAGHSPAFSAPQKYGDGIKSLVLMLNEYGNVPDKKTAEILRALSGGAIRLSDGTVNAMRESAAMSMAGTYGGIKDEIKKAEVAGVDETGVRVNGKLHWVSVYATPSHTYYEHQSKRGGHCTDSEGILAAFPGTLMHDHFRAYYKNTAAKHAECNIHGGRHLNLVAEIHKHPWAEEMAVFLIQSNRQKQEMIAAGKTCLMDQEYAAFEQEYLNILDKGDAQYTAATENLKNIKRFQEERCLLKRLRSYRAEHLRFLSNFACPFGNNDTERAVHKIKNKTRVSGGFRSDGGADNHMVIASVLMTARLQGKNVLETIREEISPKASKSGAPLSALSP
jgi:transposase